MVDWMNALRLVIILAGIIALYSIAVTPGIGGKVVVVLILVALLFLYIRQEQKSMVVNPVTEYYNKLFLACQVNKVPNLRYFVFTGDRSNQSFIKGRITGGPISKRNKELLLKKKQTIEIDSDGNMKVDESGSPVVKTELVPRIMNLEEVKEGKKPLFDPRSDGYIFVYTPQYGLLYDLPLVGNFMSMLFRREYLFCVYKHQLDSPTIYGDIVVKGINTKFIGQMEFINDWTLDYDLELKDLDADVDRVTLQDNMSLLPTRIRYAVDSNSWHLRNIDMKDELVGGH